MSVHGKIYASWDLYSCQLGSHLELPEEFTDERHHVGLDSETGMEQHLDTQGEPGRSEDGR